MSAGIVLSYREVEPLFAARERGLTQATSSIDLGRSVVEVTLFPEGVCFPGGARLSWDALSRVLASPTKCFRVEEEALEEIQVFSQKTGWVRTLMPTAGAPTTVVAGFPMHRIKDIDPREDTLRKLKPLLPLTGELLDTATGLGYTAIEAARTAKKVVTIELDPAALELARQNPWSQELFDHPRIELLSGDALQIVPTLQAERFSRILHDPPTLRLGGELYSGAFYRELSRVLQKKGRLFHYIGDPEGRAGRSITRGVIKRLAEAGFSRVLPRPEAFGVVAYK